MSGMLYLCPTPIGNLDDITLRVLKVLKEADLVACEDTRHSLKLLNHFDIKAKRVSYHEHNKKARGPELIAQLKAGLTIALISDAGMPGLSDPGADLVALAIAENIPFTVLPGPSALLPALVGSGFDTQRFTFVGFLEAQASKRKKQLEALKVYPDTLILYEAPHRLLSTLKMSEVILGDRRAVVCREISKRYETFHRGSLSELISQFENTDPKGELVLLLEGRQEPEEVTFEETVEQHLQRLIAEGVPKKEAVKQVAKARGLKKQDVYAIGVTLED